VIQVVHQPRQSSQTWLLWHWSYHYSLVATCLVFFVFVKSPMQACVLHFKGKNVNRLFEIYYDDLWCLCVCSWIQANPQENNYWKMRALERGDVDIKRLKSCWNFWGGAHQTCNARWKVVYQVLCWTR
jgi:hypothetical protein